MLHLLPQGAKGSGAPGHGRMRTVVSFSEAVNAVRLGHARRDDVARHLDAEPSATERALQRAWRRGLLSWSIDKGWAVAGSSTLKRSNDK